MLRLILGRAGSGKTTQVLQRLCRGGPDKRQILMVPEQQSHEAERALCRFGGDSISLYAEVLSFSRLSNRVFLAAGGMGEPELDAGGRILMIHRAVRSVASQLTVYARPSRRPAFLEELLSTVDELKSCCVRPELLLQAGEEAGAGGGGLKQLHRAPAGDRLRPLLGEELPLHRLEFRGLCRVLPVKGFHFTGNPLLFGQSEQLGGGAPGGREDPRPSFVLLQVVAGEGDGDGIRLFQQLPQHLLLLGSEVGKAVQPQVGSLGPGAVPQLLRRPGQPVPGVQGHLGSEGIVSPADQGQVPQLLSLRSLRLAARPLQVCRGDPAALQLVYSGDQAAEERGPPR